MGTRTRLQTNPGESTQGTASLPALIAIARTASNGASSVCKPRITSTRRITGTGLKKMHTNKIRSTSGACHRSQLRDGDRRCIRCDNTVRFGNSVDQTKYFELELNVLANHFKDHVTSGQVLVFKSNADAPQHCFCVDFRHFLLLHELSEISVDDFHSPRENYFADVQKLDRDVRC